jgi:tRNA G18 (ribose-2'-O)-methylase SpoU
MFRTADAFGVSKVYLGGYTGSPFDKLGKPVKEIAKTALGAEKTIPWEKIPQTWRLLERLKKEGVQIVALENNVSQAKALAGFLPKFPLALVVGNEVEGLSSDILKRADAVVEIPMRGKKESLNVSVACGVALYALSVSPTLK